MRLARFAITLAALVGLVSPAYAQNPGSTHVVCAMSGIAHVGAQQTKVSKTLKLLLDDLNKQLRDETGEGEDAYFDVTLYSDTRIEATVKAWGLSKEVFTTVVVIDRVSGSISMVRGFTGFLEIQAGPCQKANAPTTKF